MFERVAVVVVAGVVSVDGKILVARRKAGTHLERRWEFPGGKLEPTKLPWSVWSANLTRPRPRFEESGRSFNLPVGRSYWASWATHCGSALSAPEFSPRKPLLPAVERSETTCPEPSSKLQ